MAGSSAAGAPAAGVFPLGSARLDAALHGGIARGALHEVFGASAPGDAAAAAGFALGLALRVAEDRPLFWIRHDRADAETGALHGAGLAAFGLDPARLVMVRAGSVEQVLHAGAEAARCPPVGAVLAELWGEARAVDLTASRRLALAAEKSGVTLVMIRLGAAPVPSAATSRWSARPAPSAPLEANAPGKPAFTVSLLRHRAGIAGQTWPVEWDCDHVCFRDPAPLSGALVPVPAGREAAPQRRTGWRRTG